MSKQPKTAGPEYDPAVDVGALHGWDRNPRKNDAAVPLVAESIRTLGWGAPILARRNGEVIAGHTRLRAAELLGMATVPVRYIDVDERTAHALALADNKLGEKAQWDDAVLDSLLADLGQDFDITTLGFDSNDKSKVSDVADVLDTMNAEEPQFFISVRGRLRVQPDALAIIQRALEDLGDVSVQTGVV